MSDSPGAAAASTGPGGPLERLFGIAARGSTVTRELRGAEPAAL